MKTTGIVFAVCLFAFRLSAVTPVSADYTVHEWGTFTSVQGEDGEQMVWSPRNDWDLPEFVYDRSKPKGKNGVPGFAFRSKTAMITTQRLETPVIYFYGNEALRIDVHVDLPGGNLTEWFPRQTGPETLGAETLLEWKGLEMIPRNDPRAAEFVEKIPQDHRGSHYVAARETEANLVRMPGDAQHPEEVEKFLFYRGTGFFQAPLKVSIGGDGRNVLNLKNEGAQEIARLFIYEVRDGQIAWLPMQKLGPGEESMGSLNFPLANHGQEGLADTLRSALVDAGLFPAEAAAMVKTWESSWFAESGVRVLYLLPRDWTDTILPLKINPQPRNLVRVMVGRAEILTPQMEKQLETKLEQFRHSDSAARPEILAQTRALGLGRFIEPTMRRVMKKHPNDGELIAAGWELVEAGSGGKK